MKKIYLYLLMVLIISSCSEMIEPNPETIYDLETIKNEANKAEGLLLDGYKALPDDYEIVEKEKGVVTVAAK